MRNFYAVLALTAVLAACSSAPVEDGPGDAAKNDTWDEPAAEPAKPARPSTGDSKAEPRGGSHAELSEAIKAQSDSRILTAAEKLLWQSPEDDRALNAAAMVHYKQGRLDLASYLLGKAVGKHPRKSELHGNLGLIETARGNKGEAIAHYRKAIELNPDDSVSAANLGALYVEARDYAKALVVLEIAHRRGFRDSRVLNNYGIALAAAGKHEKALDIYDEALKENANSREALLNKAIVLVEHLDRAKEGLEVINRLKFVGAPSESRERLSLLENKANAGVR